LKPLFVYGTLKRGCRAHRLLRGSPLLDRGVVRGYTLLVRGGVPVAVSSLGECRVRGEVYLVSAPVLATLDRYEGVPKPYRRIRVSVELEGGPSIEAFMYAGEGRVRRCVSDVFYC